MKRFVMTVALACVLSVSALAGEVPTGGVPQPQAPDGITQTTTSTTSPGQVPTGGFAQQMSDVALAGLLTVLGLLAV